MVIDSSAVLAILLAEPDSPGFESAIDEASVRLISVASVLEIAFVVQSRFGDTGERELDLLLHKGGINTVAVTLEQIEWARHAARLYSKGRHPARLNYGDCFSYALARVSGEPLLYKGDDFSRTDIPRVQL